jgi:ElaB/YqjD/DUF883 family membrane-anchored ribosome-binding protein
MKKNAALEKPGSPKTPKRSKEKSTGKAKDEMTSPRSANVRERLADTGEHLQDRLQEVAGTAADGVVRRADSYVQLASDRVREIEETGHEAAGKLSARQPEVLTQTIDYIADRVGDVADYFETRDARDILEDTRRLVRDHPVPMLGAFTLLGIAAGRFLLAGSDTGEE